MIQDFGGIFVGCCCALMLLSACKHSSSKRSGMWNEVTSSFSMESEGVSYTLPTDVSLWAIAEEESLPMAMSFFGIDREAEVCVGLFCPEPPLNGRCSSRGYSQGEVYGMIREISSLQSGQKVVGEKLDCESLPDSDDNSWYFSLARKVVDSSLSIDTFAINYSGYLFDGKTRPVGLIVISSADSTDSIECSIFEKYVSGLSIMR